MALAIAAATSGHRRRRRRQQHQRKNKSSSQTPDRHRYQAALSHLGREGAARQEIVHFSNHDQNHDGIALINYCRVLHQYSATYNKHDAFLSRNILPPNNANFHFLPYRIESQQWQDGQIEKIISPFGEIGIHTPVCYPLSFIQTLPKEEFEDVMNTLHDGLHRCMAGWQDERRRRVASQCGCLYSICRTCVPKGTVTRTMKETWLLDLLEQEINARDLFRTQAMTLRYLYVGKLEGLVLSVAPWMEQGGVDNPAWSGSRPHRILPMQVEETGGVEGGEGGTCREEGVAIAALVPDNTVFESKYMCDPPTTAAMGVDASPYVVPIED